MKNFELENLLLNIRRGSDEAFEALLENYLPLVDSMSDKYARKIDFDDLGSLTQEFRQEARLALYKAALSYEIGNDGVSFGLYAKICIRNAMVSELRKLASSERKKRKAAMNAKVAGDEPDGIEEKMSLLEILKSADCGLSEYEKEVIGMVLNGRSVAQIAAETGKSAKSVSNAVFRAKRKVRTIL